MYLGNPPLNKDRSLEAEVEDIKYLIIWGVDLDQDKNVIRTEISYAMNMDTVANSSGSPWEEFKPSDLYVQRAREKFRELDWGKFDAGSKDIAATSYLYKSDPDSPACSNEQEK